MRSWKRYPKYKDSGVEWLGEIPDGWKGYKIKYLLGKSKSSIKTGPFGSQLLSSEYCDTGYKIYNQQNVILKNPAIGDDYIDEEKYRSLKDFKVYPRDLLITTRGTIGKCLTLPENCFEGILHPCLIRLQIDHLIADQHLLEIFIQESDIIIHELKINSNATTIDVIYSETLKNVHLFLPPLPEQTAIASFLDRETTRIDALIEKKQRQIELLQEKRAALISQAVTKGLDPTVPMKDSGVPWLGEVPEHWEVITNRRFITRIEQGWSPIADDRVCEEDEWGVTKLNAVSHGKFQSSAHKALPFELKPIYNYEVKNGDLLITRSNTPALVGDTCVVHDTREKLLLCDLIYRITVDEKIMDKKFVSFYWLSKSGRHQITRDARGSSQSMVKISQEHILSWVIPMPPIQEQIKIVETIETFIKNFSIIQNKIFEFKELLLEYRSALISSAVTGKIDVRDTLSPPLEAQS